MPETDKESIVNHRYLPDVWQILVYPWELVHDRLPLLFTCHNHFFWLEVRVADRVQKALPFCLANAVLHRSLCERGVRECLEGGVLVPNLRKQISVRCLPDVYENDENTDVYQVSGRRLR